MSLQHLCFLSYRHLGNDRAHRYVSIFHKELTAALSEHRPNASIYFDEERIHPGYTADKNLAVHLCQSATLVMFFTSEHFDVEHPYCALEYQVMRELEEKRRKYWLPEFADRRLIFPVMVRLRRDPRAEISILWLSSGQRLCWRQCTCSKENLYRRSRC